jgi:hypothetical protein
MAQSSTRNLFFALIAGVVGGALMPSLRPLASGKARPVAKQVIRAGLLLYEHAREAAEEWAETASDLIAEVQSEFEGEQQSAAAPEPDDEQVIPFETRSVAEPERKLHA